MLRSLALSAAAVALGFSLVAAAPARADVEILDIPLNTFNSVSGTVDLTSAFTLPRSNYRVTVTAFSSPDFDELFTTTVGTGFFVDDNDVAHFEQNIIHHEVDTGAGQFSLIVLGGGVSGHSPVHDDLFGPGSVITAPDASCPHIYKSCVTDSTNYVEQQGAWGPVSITYVLTAAEVAQANADGGFDYKVSNNNNGQERLLNLRVTSLPEPGAWALMILGFGGAGVGLRRRRLPASA